MITVVDANSYLQSGRESGHDHLHCHAPQFCLPRYVLDPKSQSHWLNGSKASISCFPSVRLHLSTSSLSIEHLSYFYTVYLNSYLASLNARSGLRERSNEPHSIHLSSLSPSSIGRFAISDPSRHQQTQSGLSGVHIPARPGMGFAEKVRIGH